MDASRKGRWARCPFCRSRDTDYPYRRSSRIFLLTSLFPALRRRYCRNCARHYFALVPKSRRR